MTSQFSPKVSEILAYSREEAARLTSRSVAPEHILLGLLRLKSGPVTDFFKRLNINTVIIKRELEERVKNEELGQPINTSELVLNEKASNILKLAVLEARIQHLRRVDEQHILMAILHDNVNNGAKEVLESNGVTYDDVNAILYQKNRINDGIDLPEEEDSESINSNNNDRQQSHKQETTQAPRATGKTPVLDNFGTDLTLAASEGKLDPVVGRDFEISRVIEILGRRKKNNPILIGEPGVGKSAIVEGLAQLIVKREVSPLLFGKRIISLDLTGIVAGTKYRGQFEERIKALIKEIEQNPDVIIFIDEIHTMIGAGSTPGSMDAANILKPALARGTIQCIGATTFDEYRNSIEKDGALERRFQKVMVEPTSEDETLTILNNIKDRYENHHKVIYTDDSLRACVRLTERYVTDRQFPDKAIDALDETGSRIHMKNVHIPPEIAGKEKEINIIKIKKQEAVHNQNFELAASYRDKQTELEKELKELNDKWANGECEEPHIVTEKDVAEVVSIMTGIPVQQMSESESIRLKGMAEELKHNVIAQDKAIDKMVKAIQRNRIGLRNPKHPIGAFMFLGPTGVGKTFLAKKLAEFMFGTADALIRIDMSEYTESFNVSRLVGAPPGYVGYEEGGQLTEKVRRHPYSIVLLDEIEKAHGNVFNLLLQVLDEGRLTDGNGRFVDFKNTVIILTSNTGTRQLKEFSHGVGFNANNTSNLLNEKDREYARNIIKKSLNKQFTPEFLNRFDEIIMFDQLDLPAIRKIIDIEMKDLLRRINKLGYSIEITNEAKEFIASKGYDIQFGARPLKRAIRRYVEDKLCELIINGGIDNGHLIKIDLAEDKHDTIVTI